MESVETGDHPGSAIEHEIHDAVTDFVGRSLRYRRWSPWHDVPVEEIRRLGSRLSDDTICILYGFLGIEEHIGDYVLEAMQMLRGSRDLRNLHLQWGAEEMRHGAAIEQVLSNSGSHDQAETQTYLSEMRQYRWSPTGHSGMDTPLGVSIYAMIQERATYANYQELRLRVRQEYGLPDRPTAEERSRRCEVGASEVLRLIAQDEIAHHGIFLKLVQIYLRHAPELALQKLDEVVEGFNMPALRLIPNRREFIRAVARTGLHDADVHHEKVSMPVLRALGLGGDVGDVSASRSRRVDQGLTTTPEI